MLGLEYNTAVVLAGTAALGLAAGSTGSLALLRRRALLADALSHATLPGICIAFMVTGSRSFAALLTGALITGILGVLVVVMISRRGKIREDAAIGIVLGTFFGGGIALSGIIQRRGADAAQAGLDSFLLGQTAGMLLSDAITIGVIALITVALVVLLGKEWKLICFDPDFAGVEGWPVRALDLLLMLLITVTVVIALPAVGVVLTAAILIIPATAARLWVDRLGPMLILASIFGVLSGSVGTVISAGTAGLPAGPVIVLSASAIFVVSLLFSPRRGIIARARSRVAQRRRQERRRLLGSIYEGIEESHVPMIGEAELARRRSWGPGRMRKHLEKASRRGLIVWGSTGIALTDSGKTLAEKIVRDERIWQQYLLSQAQIDRDLIDLDAAEIGQILPKAMVEELEAVLRAKGRLPGAAAIDTETPGGAS